MKLLEDPFEQIKSGAKTVEIRLFDEKRKVLRVGDIIEFSKLPNLHEKIKVKVLELLQCESFKSLTKNFDIKSFGYKQDFSIEKFLESIYKIYSKDEEKRYGVLGIKLEILK